MRTLILGIATVTLIAADEPQATEGQRVQTTPEVKLSARSPEFCRDRITMAREAAGQPPLLDREPASPDKPHRIYAVDKRIDGCSVMVAMGNPDDIRPLPAPSEGTVIMMPAKSGQ
jgi:hypothetical protein